MSNQKNTCRHVEFRLLKHAAKQCCSFEHVSSLSWPVATILVFLLKQQDTTSPTGSSTPISDGWNWFHFWLCRTLWSWQRGRGVPQGGPMWRYGVSVVGGCEGWGWSRQKVSKAKYSKMHPITFPKPRTKPRAPANWLKHSNRLAGWRHPMVAWCWGARKAFVSQANGENGSRGGWSLRWLLNWWALKPCKVVAYKLL